jgi:hypothetical protein
VRYSSGVATVRCSLRDISAVRLSDPEVRPVLRLTERPMTFAVFQNSSLYYHFIGTEELPYCLLRLPPCLVSEIILRLRSLRCYFYPCSLAHWAKGPEDPHVRRVYLLMAIYLYQVLSDFARTAVLERRLACTRVR